ncbi:MAG: hypothetical protein JKY19_13525 [Alcanivoracaceae bacterium]|nr:hypothetical protein [Alcanivoracaceae bacterium]
MIKKSHVIIFSLLTLVSLTVCSAEKQQYEVKVDHLKKQLQVKLCFDDAPDYLYATSDNAEKLVSHIYWTKNSVQKQIRQRRGYIDLPDGESGCLSYRVNAKLNRGRLSSSKFALQHPNDSILSIGSWLWKSSTYNRSSQSSIKFLHKSGINISTPWSLISRSATTTEFLIKYTPDSWVGYVAFGQFEIEHLNLQNSHLRLALINGNNSYNKQSIIDWIKQMADAVAVIGDDFPIKEAQVMVILLTGSRGAVPWGQVNRAGGSGVLFIANPASSHADLIADWTAAHEFSHLLLPYTPDDRWLSEGFASYHQNISRARTGLLDEKTTWEKLLAGFERGRKAAGQYNAPALESASMKHLMQMYWGGAVIALKADVALQEQTNGKVTLSIALDKLNDCCLETGQEWSAKETFSRLDRITGTHVFMQLYRQEVQVNSYPKYQNLLKELGVLQNRYGQIYLDDRAKKAHLRKKIING